MLLQLLSSFLVLIYYIQYSRIPISSRYVFRYIYFVYIYFLYKRILLGVLNFGMIYNFFDDIFRYKILIAYKLNQVFSSSSLSKRYMIRFSFIEGKYVAANSIVKWIITERLGRLNALRRIYCEPSAFDFY